MQPSAPASSRELRQFGVIMAIAIVAIFELLLPWLWGRPWPTWPVGVAAVLLVLAALLPVALGPVRAGWLRVGHVLGWINTRILLAVLFFLIIVPLGVVLRILGKQPIRWRKDSDAKTYRVVSAARADAKGMERPF